MSCEAYAIHAMTVCSHNTTAFKIFAWPSWNSEIQSEESMRKGALQVISLKATGGAIAALKSNGSVLAWGAANGDSLLLLHPTSVTFTPFK